LDERYADVIVKRYIGQTGNTDGVFLIRDGETIPCDKALKKDS
jgi:site-specific DNA-methyltransferase (adenine-specific)